MPKSGTIPSSQVSPCELSASTAVGRDDELLLEVPDCAAFANGDSHEFGPLQGRSGPFARWEGFEPSAERPARTAVYRPVPPFTALTCGNADLRTIAYQGVSSCLAENRDHSVTIRGPPAGSSTATTTRRTPR